MKNQKLTISKFIITEDSFVLAVLSDGTITNGDMTFKNIEELTHPIKGVDVFDWEEKHNTMQGFRNQKDNVIITLIEDKVINWSKSLI